VVRGSPSSIGPRLQHRLHALCPTLATLGSSSPIWPRSIWAALDTVHPALRKRIPGPRPPVVPLPANATCILSLVIVRPFMAFFASCPACSSRATRWRERVARALKSASDCAVQTPPVIVGSSCNTETKVKPTPGLLPYPASLDLCAKPPTPRDSSVAPAQARKRVRYRSPLLLACAVTRANAAPTQVAPLNVTFIHSRSVATSTATQPGNSRPASS
jgi:hypothetical protein